MPTRESEDSLSPHGTRWDCRTPQLLQRFAVVGTTTHGRMQPEPVDVGAQFLFEATSLGIAPRSVNTFWPARGPYAIRVLTRSNL